MDDIGSRLRQALERVLASGGVSEPSSLGAGELMGAIAAHGELRRLLDAAYAPLAAEVSRQSRPELGRESLARRQGFRNPASLIAATSGASTSDALKLVRVGKSIAPRVSLSGQTLPAERPFIAAAVEEGALGASAADAIGQMLDRVALRTSREQREAAERQLVGIAPGLTPEQFHRAVVRVEALLDPDGLEPVEARLREERYLVVREERSGAISIKGLLDPESGAPVKALFDGMVTHALRTRGRGDGPLAGDDDAGGRRAAGADDGARAGGDGDAERDGTAELDGRPLGDRPADARTVNQMRADALADVARHALGCRELAAGASATVIVRMSLEALQAGVGQATIDGVDRPVSAAAARRLAADAEVIPVVLGSRSEILDWGRAARLFTPAQKLALAERDGGCAFCGAPPAQCAAHHIGWWARDHGTTDLKDGVLLCTACHHRVHDDGWEIDVRGTGTRAEVWFTPPPFVDHRRRPRRGLRAHYELAT